MTAYRCGDLTLDARLFEVDEHGDLTFTDEVEDIVELQCVRGQLARRVRDDEAVADVELDSVGPCGDCGLEGLDRVLGSENRRAAMSDHERTAGAREVHVLRATTIAQSSRSSPPANARQSASTAAARA